MQEKLNSITLNIEIKVAVIPQLPPTMDCNKIKPAGGFVRNPMTESLFKSGSVE